MTNLDAAMSLKRPKDYKQMEGARFEIHWDKARSFFGTDAEAFEARLVDGHWQMSKPSTADRVVKKVLNALNGGAALTKKELYGALGNSVRAAELNVILAGLVSEGIISEFDSPSMGGRPAKVYVRPDLC